MPFRCRQKMQSYSAGEIFFQVGVPNPDTGIVEFSDVSQQVSLPSSDMTDLSACLKAGVSLDKVNCKLVSPDTHALAERLNLIKDEPEIGSKTEPKIEPKNEDK